MNISRRSRARARLGARAMPSSWRDVDRARIGVDARAIASRRRRREGVETRRSLKDDSGTRTKTLDANDGEVVRANAMKEDARLMTTEDAQRLMATEHGEATIEGLRDAAERARRGAEADDSRRKMLAAECLPAYLAGLDVAADAREALVRAREEGEGGFGAARELEARCERASRLARDGLREVFELEERRGKLERALETLERRRDVFGIPGVVREALARGEYENAADERGRATAALEGSAKDSAVLRAVLDDVENAFSSAAEHLFERLYVGELNDDEAEQTVIALQTLGVSTSETDVGDAPMVYVDRLVEWACEDLANVESTIEDDDVEVLGRACRANFMRAWRFAELTGATRSPRERHALDKIQLAYVNIVKSRFDAALNTRTIASESRSTRRFDRLLEKCSKMTRIGLSLSRTYDVLHTRLELKPCAFEAMFQQHMRCSVSIRVHLEQALKIASQNIVDGDHHVKVVRGFFRDDARAVFEIAARYWQHKSLTHQMIKSGSRDLSTLVDAFYASASSLLITERREVLRDLRFAMDLRDEFDALCESAMIDIVHVGDPIVRMAFVDASKRSVDALRTEFVDATVNELVALSQKWLRAPADSSVIDSRRECIDVISAIARAHEAAMRETPRVALELAQAIILRLVDAVRRDFAEHLLAFRPVMRHLRLEFDLFRLALDSLSPKPAREGTARLVDLVSRVAGSCEDTIARSSAIERDAATHAELISKLAI